MPRKSLYPEGSVSVHIVLSVPVKDGLERAAERQRQSVSYLVNTVMENYLLRQGDFREVEAAI